MVKRFTVTLGDYVFERLIPKNLINRSRFIEELIVKGAEMESGENDTKMAKIIEKNKKIIELEEIIRQDKVKMERLQKQLEDKKKFGEGGERLYKLQRWADALRLNNPLRDKEV